MSKDTRPMTTAERERALSRTVDLNTRDMVKNSGGKMTHEQARKEAVESARRVDRQMRDGD